MNLATGILIGAALLGLYTYVGYPLLVAVLGRRRRLVLRPEPREWPRISFSVPAYNEEAEIGETIEALLAIDYPADRRQIIVVSDASTDRTDEIVSSYADRGVELVRQPVRQGKTAAEELAGRKVTGEIVINTDASIRIAPHSIKPLVRQFQDARVGVASGRDISISRLDREQNTGEAGYVGYEMAVRDAETRYYGIVGASGCLYAIRTDLHRLPLPQALSRDFASALHAEENGFRAVSVPEAICYVPRVASLQVEYRRKTRTIERGMHTLWHKRHLLNPFRHPAFAWMLWSHKIARWALPWAGLAACLALSWLAPRQRWAAVLSIGAALALAVGLAGWRVAARGRSLPRVVAILAYGLVGNIAAMRAFLRLVFGGRHAMWEPTRRSAPVR